MSGGGSSEHEGYVVYPEGLGSQAAECVTCGVTSPCFATPDELDDWWVRHVTGTPQEEP